MGYTCTTVSYHEKGKKMSIALYITFEIYCVIHLKGNFYHNLFLSALLTLISSLNHIKGGIRISSQQITTVIQNSTLCLISILCHTRQRRYPRHNLSSNSIIYRAPGIRWAHIRTRLEQYWTSPILIIYAGYVGAYIQKIMQFVMSPKATECELSQYAGTVDDWASRENWDPLHTRG